MLRYDFEMFCANTSPVQDGLSVTGALAAHGKSKSNAVIAFFRDQQTADAVTSSPPIVRLFLEEAGFGLSPSGADTAENDSSDDDAAVADFTMRRTLVEQVTIALSNRALKKALARAAKHSEFDVAAFIAVVVSKDPPEASYNADETTLPASVTPRRPYQLRGKGLKSRLRPC